jgi:acetoin utilization deacetylase AcuC-like enzyme
MPHGSSEAVFFEKLEEAVLALRTFEPEAFVLALGFDIYREDPQAKVAVSSDGFRRIGESVNSFNVPTLVVQEGGYHLEALGENTR